MFAFATLEKGLLATVESNDLSMYSAIEALRGNNPSLKVLLSVGGWTMGSGPFSDMVTNSTTRAAFVSSSLTFLQQNGFDGLDVDWVCLFDLIFFLNYVEILILKLNNLNYKRNSRVTNFNSNEFYFK
jgi:hypothetical protein